VDGSARTLIPIFTGSLITALVLLLAVPSIPLLPVAPALSARSGSETVDQAPGILLSRQLMDEVHLKVGDIVTLAANPAGSRAVQFQVLGRYEPVPDPMKFTQKRFEARLHLPDLIALSRNLDDPLSAESVDALNVALTKPEDASAIASMLTSRTPGLLVRSTVRPTDGGDPFVVLDRFHWAIAIVTVLGSTAFLLALMVMRAEERREVIHILRLMGIPTRSILIEVLLEGLVIATAGAVFGILVAGLAQGVVNRFFQWRYDTTLVFVRVTFSIAWRAAAFAVPLGVIAGLGASWTLLRREAVSLIRR
jgi:predicted lysophospholipase L1 biosynthesis ABC-type transport system permease subunit